MTAIRRFLPGWLSSYAILYLLFLYLPVIFLPIFSINTAATPKFPLSGVTLHWYEDLPRTPALIDATWNSLIVGVSASILSTVLGILAARSITRYRYPGRRAINGLIMAPLVLPEVIVAISMLLVMLQLGLSLSLFTVVLGHVLVCIPYSMTVLTSGFEGFDRSLEEASADLGESAFGTFRRVTLPMVAPAIISEPARLLHHLARRIHHRLLPHRHRGDAADLHLGPVAVCSQASRRAGARHLAALCVLPADDDCRNPAPPRGETHPE